MNRRQSVHPSGRLGRRVASRQGDTSCSTRADASHAVPRPDRGTCPASIVSFHCAPATRRALARNGFTLFEVVLALGIFLGALAAISRIVDSGSRAAVRARLQNEAILRCESQMNQVIAGSVALQATEQAQFEDDANWSWSLVLGEGPHVDLLNVEVVVTHARPDGEVDAEFALWRLMRNPELYLEAAAAAEEAESTTTDE